MAINIYYKYSLDLVSNFTLLIFKFTILDFYAIQFFDPFSLWLVCFKLKEVNYSLQCFPKYLWQNSMYRRCHMEKLFHGQINMESVTIVSLSDKREINMPKCVLSNISLMDLTVEPILHVALINFPGIQWSMKHFGKWYSIELWEASVFVFFSLFLGYGILKHIWPLSAPEGYFVTRCH